MSEIISLVQIFKRLSKLKQKVRKIVLVTGCFDILHSAHEKFLRRAKKEGDWLLVGLESDQRVRKLKGKARPVNTFAIRAKNLAKIPQVDLIFPLPVKIGEPQIQESLLSGIKPDVLAVSSHTQHLDEKKRIVEKNGGKLKIVLVQDPTVSSTKILKEKNFC